MSIRLMSAVWETDLPATEKMVLLALADAANDDGLCWPSMAQLVRKCSRTDRAIQAAIKTLDAGGWLTRDEKPGKGVVYTIADPRNRFAPEVASPPKKTTSTPEAVSGKPSRTINIPQKATPSSGARATRLPDVFIPRLTGKTADIVAEWPPGRLQDELEHFADFHTAKGTTSRDWQASFRTWVRNARKWEPRYARQSQQHRGAGPTIDAGCAFIADGQRH